MANIIYHRLCNLTVSHTYYNDGLAKGISLSPTKETIRLLKSGNMILKHLPKKDVILFRGLDDDPTNPFIDLGNDFKIVLALHVRNKSEFTNITDLDVGLKEYAAGNFLYFKNDPPAASPEVITHTLLDSVRSDTFSYSFVLPPATGVVDFTLIRINDDNSETPVSSGTDASGAPLPVTIQLDQDAQDRYEHSVNIRNQPPGRYKIRIEPNGGGPPLREEDIYINAQLVSAGAIGVVEIVYNDLGKAYGSTEDYNIHFESKGTKWRYHIVDKSGHLSFPGDNLKIVHGDFSNPPGGTGPHPTINVIGKPTVVMTSDNTIPFSEIPILNIELQRDVDDEVIIEHLSNPSINSNVKKEGADLTSEIFVFL